jgi:ABC-2 type transport system permease protein
MTLSCSRIAAILKKELLQLIRDRTTAAMVFFIPIMQLILFGYAINNDPRHLTTAVLSRDNGSFTRSFVSGLQNSEYFRITKEIRTDEDGRRLLQQGNVQFVVTIPDGFSRDLVRKEKPSILIEADATDPTTTTGAISALDGILMNTCEKELKGSLSFLKNNANPINIVVHRMYNPEGFTNYNTIPGLIGVILLFTGLVVTALSLTRERERGTMENMLSMPVKAVEVIIGKIVPYVLIGFLQAIVTIFMARFLFNIPILGSKFLLALALLIFIICNLSLGVTISTLVKNQMQSIQMVIFCLLPSIILSGFMFPFYGMPKWAQAIGSCIPMTYFIRISKGIMLKGSNFIELWPHFWPLMIFMIVIGIIAVKAYRQTLD